MVLVISSIIAFASTNIDDIFVLMLFFGNNHFKTKEVVIGQYLGISALVLISFLGSFIGLVVDVAYIGFLSLLPVLLGIKALVKHFSKLNNNQQTPEIEDVKIKKGGNVLSVAAVTFSNGGDNIGIYIPLFATLSLVEKLSMIFVFSIMIAIWCLIGKYLSKHPVVSRVIDKYGHILTPIVLILLGLYIIYESGTLALITR